MAFGLIPHYSVVFPIEDLSESEFLVVIREAAHKLGWNVSHSDLHGLTAFTKFRKGSVNEKIRISVEGGLVTLKSESLGGQFFDRGHNRRNTEEFISCYDEVRSSISAEDLSLKASALTELAGDAIHSGSEPILQTDEKTKGILSIFTPVRGYFITPILIDLNILVFLLMIISGVHILSPDTESLLRWGANFRPVTLDGQPWRLLTCTFLHIGIFHLLLNMYALLYIGILLEPRLGSRQFGIAYLITGVIGSLASLYFHEATVSAGASGSIFGMYGVFLAMLTTDLIEKSQRKALLTSIAVFVGYNLMNGLKGNIDNAAHVGGLVSGIFIGYSFFPGLHRPQVKKLQWSIPAMVIGGLLLFSIWGYKRIPRDIIVYQKGMEKFLGIEKKALHFFNNPEQSSQTPSTDEMLVQIKDTSLVYWHKGKNLILQLDSLNIPKNLHRRNEKLVAYCDLRIRCFELMYKSFADSTHVYDPGILAYNESIDSLINTFNKP